MRIGSPVDYVLGSGSNSRVVRTNSLDIRSSKASVKEKDPDGRSHEKGKDRKVKEQMSNPGVLNPLDGEHQHRHSSSGYSTNTSPPISSDDENNKTRSKSSTVQQEEADKLTELKSILKKRDNPTPKSQESYREKSLKERREQRPRKPVNKTENNSDGAHNGQKSRPPATRLDPKRERNQSPHVTKTGAKPLAKSSSKRESKSKERTKPEEPKRKDVSFSESCAESSHEISDDSGAGKCERLISTTSSSGQSDEPINQTRKSNAQKQPSNAGSFYQPMAVRRDRINDEANRLQGILMSIDPEDLYHYTVARLSHRDPKVIDALRALLPAIDIERLASLSTSSSDHQSDDGSGKSHRNSIDTSESGNSPHQYVSDEDHPAEDHSSGSSSFLPHSTSPSSSCGNLVSTTSSTTTSDITPSTTGLSTEIADSNVSLNDVLKPKAPNSTSGSEVSIKNSKCSKKPSKLKRSNTKTSKSASNKRVQQQHCLRCHKNFVSASSSAAELRCTLPHPESMVLKINQDDNGSEFKCLACTAEFRLNGMNFYEEGTNSMLTGFCNIGQHTTDPENVDFRVEGGCAKTCEENGCVEFYV